MNATTIDRFDVKVHRDICYATARIGYNGGAGPMQDRPLCLDWYQPVGATGPLPALVLAFGGAFHRGSKESDVRPEDGPKNTAIAEYCAMFAARGFACFSIDYRLTQEDPHPGHTPTLGPEPVPTSRIDVVRKLLGLPPATSDMLRNEQEAAVDDVVSAYRFVAGEAGNFNVDAARIAVGGFSAGARVAGVAAMAEAISPAAVVALSGMPARSIVDKFHASGRARMPFFLAWGEDDLDYVIPGAKAVVETLDAVDQACEWCTLPGQTHFYPSSAAVIASHGEPQDLEQAIENFLTRHLA
jgi:acetyl esterase/lipase